MSPSENCFGLSTSRARMMRPAHVPKIGLPPWWNVSMAGLLEWGGAVTNGAALLGGSARMKVPGAAEARPRPGRPNGAGARRCREAARREVRHGELAGLGDPAHELVRRAERLRLGHQLL